MTGAPHQDAGHSLRDAVAAPDWARERHGRSLAETALTALKRRDGLLAWLLADRLARISAGRNALPYVLRASALAQLGKTDSARADLATARRLDPDDRFTNEALLHFASPDDRARGARHLLLAGDQAGLSLALRALAQDGIRSVVRAEAHDGVLRAQVFWRDGGEQVSLRISDGTALRTLALQGGDPGPSLAPFDRMADVATPWPEAAAAVSLTCDAGPCFAVPGVVHGGTTKAGLPRLPNPANDVRRGLLIVVPVYDDPDATTDCLDSLKTAIPDNARIVVVEDAAPDPTIPPMLAARAERGEFSLLRNPLNLGFAASVNRALALRADHEDVLLLNADTIVPPGAIERLAAAVHREGTIGTATPLSNNGEDTSFPARFAANALPDPASLGALDRVAAHVNHGIVVEMPNGVGFCLYVKAEVAAALGPLSLTFGRGYYEDVDYCLRAADAGWRNVCATDVVVGHSGSRSFRAEKHALVRRNLPLLAGRFPDYLARSRSFFRNDPLAEPISRLEEAWIGGGAPVALAVCPDDVPEWLAERLLPPPGDGRRVLIARVATADSDTSVTIRLRAADGGIPQTVTWRFPGGPALTRLLREKLAIVPVASLTIIDPDALPGGVVAAVRNVVASLQVAVASPERAGDVLRGLVGRRDGLTVATRAAADALSGRVKARARVPNVPAPTAPAAGSPKHLAVLAEDGGSRADWALARAIARRLRASDPGAALAFLGAPPDDADLTQAEGVYPTGPLGRDETAAWLSLCGGAACVIASRPFGANDPRSEAWPRAGTPVACFEPRASRLVRRGLALAIPPDFSDDEAAEAVVRWWRAIGRR